MFYRHIKVGVSFLSKQVAGLSYKQYYCSYKTRNKKMEPLKTIKDLGYMFNSNGQLRKISKDGTPGDESFTFNISDDHQECQAHYEELGAAVTNYVYNLLETVEKLQRLAVPKYATSTTGTFVFASQDYDKKDVLVVLIHGSGVVRAGQWARSLIINDNLETGSQIPYIREGVQRGYGVIILNSNDNFTADGQKIPNSSSPEQHSSYVWETYIKDTNASKVVIVAHSYGGVVVVSLAEKFANDFEKRVKAVVMTDSVHGGMFKVSPILKKVARNWVSSEKPLDTSLRTPENDITRVSAGHPKHEMTSHSCIKSAFKFIEENLKN